MTIPLVSIVIVNWNGESVLSDCLSSVFEQAYSNIEVIVVDNNSQDNSKALIRKKFKKVILIENEKNLGFAGGNNCAYRVAKGRYLLLLNSDTICTKQFLVTLVNLMERQKNVAVVQPKILYQDNPGYKKNSINAIGAFFTYTGFCIILDMARMQS